MGADGVRSGWEAGTRVPVTGPVCDVGDAGDGEGNVRVSAGWWPSEGEGVLRLEVLTAEEAAAVSCAVREQVVLWMGGGGLYPADVLARMVEVCGWVGVPLRGRGRAELMRELRPTGPGGWRGTERMVRGALDEAALRGRYERLTDGRSLRELVDWMVGESLEVPGGMEGMDVWCWEDEVGGVVHVTMGMLARWLVGSGTSAAAVLQRFYGLVFWRYKGLLGGMTGEDLGGLLCRGRAAFCELTSRLFEVPGEILLGYRPKTTGQKSVESSPVYAANAGRHCPRRQLSGTAGLGGAELEALATGEARRAIGVATLAATEAADWEVARAYVDFTGPAADRRRRFGRLSGSQAEKAGVLARRDAEEFERRLRRVKGEM